MKAPILIALILAAATTAVAADPPIVNCRLACTPVAIAQCQRLIAPEKAGKLRHCIRVHLKHALRKCHHFNHRCPPPVGHCLAPTGICSPSGAFL
jgi:hypothetical protein